MSGFTVVNCTPGMDTLEEDFAKKLTLNDNNKDGKKKSTKATTKGKGKVPVKKKKAPKKTFTDEEIAALVEERVYKTQENLCLNDVTPEELKEAGKLILPEHYDEITEERVASHKCAYPCCTNSISGEKHTGKYYFSLTKVYDMTHAGDFCSKQCNISSRLFRKTIEEIPLLLRTGYKDIADLMNNGGDSKEVKPKDDEKAKETASFGSEAVIEHEIDDSGIAIGGVDEEKIREAMKSDSKVTPYYSINVNPNAIEGYEVPAFRNAKVSVPGTSCDLTSRANYNMFGFEFDDDDDDEYFDVDEEDDYFFDDGGEEEEEEGDIIENEDAEPKERAMSERYKFMRLSEEGWVTFFLKEWKTDYTNMEIRKLEMPLEANKIGSTKVIQDDEESRMRKQSFSYMIDTRYKMLMDEYDFPFGCIRNGAYGIFNTFMFRDQIPAFSEKQLVMFCLVLAEIVRSRVLDRDAPELSGAVFMSTQKIMSAYKIPRNKIDDIIRSFL